MASRTRSASSSRQAKKSKVDAQTKEVKMTVAEARAILAKQELADKKKAKTGKTSDDSQPSEKGSAMEGGDAGSSGDEQPEEGKEEEVEDLGLTLVGLDAEQVKSWEAIKQSATGTLADPGKLFVKKTSSGGVTKWFTPRDRHAKAGKEAEEIRVAKEQMAAFLEKLEKPKD